MRDLFKDDGALAELRLRLEKLRTAPPAADPAMVADVVRTVLATMRGDIGAAEATLLSEVEELGRIISDAKSEIAALGADEITASHIPLATDELDAIVAHTASATDSILETCETLDRVAVSLQRASTNGANDAAAAQLQEATTRIYEACSFQDITGQRITKVVSALKVIEAKVNQIVTSFGVAAGPAGARERPEREHEEALLNGPQLPAVAMDQSDIDKLLASFD